MHYCGLRYIFDSFDPEFFFELNIAIGLPRRVATLDRFMNLNTWRMIKIGGHFAKPFTGNKGAGQGNTFSVLGALGITTIECRVIDAKHPEVKKTSPVDDITFR